MNRRNVYENARKRCVPIGVSVPTDAEIICQQEEEIQWLKGEVSWYKKRVEKLEAENGAKDFYGEMLEKAAKYIADEKAEAYLNHFKPFTIRVDIEEDGVSE